MSNPNNNQPSNGGGKNSKSANSDKVQKLSEKPNLGDRFSKGHVASSQPPLRPTNPKK